MEKTIEQKVADTILEKEQSIIVGETTYLVAPPSTATLILVSELVSQMPNIILSQDINEMRVESLKVARDCKVIGDIIAVMILGAKRIKARVTRRVKGKPLFWVIPTTQDEEINEQAELAKTLLEDLTPHDLALMVNELLNKLQISFFFNISNFLIGINLTKATKQEETIQSGQ